MIALSKMNSLQKEIFTGVLDDPYAILAIDGDKEKTINRAMKVLPALEICIERDIQEADLRKEVSHVLKALRESCKSRNKGLTLEMREQLHFAKYKWAKYVCANFSITTMHSLEKLSKNVWGNRLPDKYREELLTHLSNHPSLFEESDEVVEVFEPEEERVHIQVGGLKITLAKGSELTLKEVISETFSVKGCTVTVGEVDRGVLKDVLIQS